MSDILTSTRQSIVADVLANLIHYETMDGYAGMAEKVIDKLNKFDSALTNPPGQPQNVPAYGDPKSTKVVEALIANPEVLYGVLGILHNLNVAGPWEHTTDKAGGERWFRCDARRGPGVAQITLPDKIRGHTQWCKWVIQGRRKTESDLSGNSPDLASAMAEVDTYLGVQQGYILVPGFKEA